MDDYYGSYIIGEPGYFDRADHPHEDDRPCNNCGEFYCDCDLDSDE